MKQLHYYAGNGFEGVAEHGKFKVVANETKHFDLLPEARKYYEGLNEEKALWDIAKVPELLDCYTY